MELMGIVSMAVNQGTMVTTAIGNAQLVVTVVTQTLTVRSVKTAIMVVYASLIVQSHANIISATRIMVSVQKDVNLDTLA